jgi:hypothetical protein
LEILDFAPLVKKYTWNKSDDEKAEAWLAVVEAFAAYDSNKGVRFRPWFGNNVFVFFHTVEKKTASI